MPRQAPESADVPLSERPVWGVSTGLLLAAVCSCTTGEGPTRGAVYPPRQMDVAAPASHVWTPTVAPPANLVPIGFQSEVGSDSWVVVPRNGWPPCETPCLIAVTPTGELGIDLIHRRARELDVHIDGDDLAGSRGRRPAMVVLRRTTSYGQMIGLLSGAAGAALIGAVLIGTGVSNEGHGGGGGFALDSSVNYVAGGVALTTALVLGIAGIAMGGVPTGEFEIVANR